MAKFVVDPDATNVTMTLFIQNSSLTTGAGRTGLTNATASLICHYIRPRSNVVAVALNTVTNIYDPFASGAFKELDATNMTGFYRFDPPNAAFASGLTTVAFSLQGAAHMAPLPIEVEIRTTTDTLNKYVINKKAIEKDGTNHYLLIKDNDGTTNIVKKLLTNINGGVIDDLTAGALASEDASNIL